MHMKAPAFLRRRMSADQRLAALDGHVGDPEATIVLEPAPPGKPDSAHDEQRADADATMVLNRARAGQSDSGSNEGSGDADATMVLGRALVRMLRSGATIPPAAAAPSASPAAPLAPPASTVSPASHRRARGRIRSHAKVRDRKRMIITGTGEGLITLGVIILLFCVYQLYYTNVEANRAQAEERAELRENWAPPPAQPESSEPTEPVPEDFSDILPSDGIAIMHIPRLGDDWEKPVLEGVGLDLLARGLGHYPDSAMPGEIGNFAVAGHRMTHGEPFRNLDKLQPGDVVIVETEHNWYRYVMDEWEIVLPTQVDVVAPVPKQPGAEPSEALITLTTCHPRWSSEKRLIWWGHLESVQSKAAGTPPELS